MEQTNIKVIIKPRPRIQREKDANETEQWSINGNTIECKNPLVNQHRYVFGRSFLLVLFLFSFFNFYFKLMQFFAFIYIFDKNELILIVI